MSDPHKVGSGSHQYDVIVLGSGMSGLACAIILAKEGMRVLVLEQHYRAGGLLHRFFRPKGEQFDIGFHYVGSVGRDQVLGSYLRYLEVWDAIDFLPLDSDGYDELRFPDFKFLVPVGREAYRERLLSTFPQQRAAIDKYFVDLKNICDDFPLYRLQTPRELAHLDKWMSCSVRDYIDGLTADPKLRAVLLGQSFLYGVEAERAPLALHALVVDSFLDGASAIRGGGDALAQAMVRKIGSMGGEIRLRKEVTQILVDEARQVTGVRVASGEIFEASRVVSSIHPKSTVRLLPEGVLRPGYRRRVLGFEDGISCLQVFLSTQADMTPYAGRNIYYFKDSDFSALYANAGRPHRFAFVTSPTAREGVSSSGNHHVIGLGLMNWESVKKWANTKPQERGPEYEAFKSAQAEELLGLMRAAMPELHGSVERVEAATALTCRDFTGSEKGASYGIHHTIEQTGRHGLLPRTRVNGLFLTGQSVLMPGVCGTTISAFQTCSAILGSEYLLGRVNAAI